MFEIQDDSNMQNDCDIERINEIIMHLGKSV